ncbi:hypothetical protein BLA29_009372, partial [Euroglyphus maynei]
MKKLKIAIIGGGIIGVTTGLAIQQHLDDHIEMITIFSDQWTPNTTGDVSAGLIYPYFAAPDTPVERMERILIESFRFFNQLIQDPQSSHFGVSYLTLFELFNNNDDANGGLPIASHELPLIRQLNPNEIQRLFPTIQQQYQHCNLLRSARGQVMRVKAPWIRHGILADDWYILPQIDCV